MLVLQRIYVRNYGNMTVNYDNSMRRQEGMNYWCSTDSLQFSFPLHSCPHHMNFTWFAWSSNRERRRERRKEGEDGGRPKLILTVPLCMQFLVSCCCPFFLPQYLPLLVEKYITQQENFASAQYSLVCFTSSKLRDKIKRHGDLYLNVYAAPLWIDWN